MQKQQEVHQRYAAELGQEMRMLESQATALKTKLHDAERETSDLRADIARRERELQSVKSSSASKASEASERAEKIQSLQNSLKHSEQKVS